MDHNFYIRKIKELSDEKLKELIQLKTKANQEIIGIAEKEAIQRGIDLETIHGEIPEHRERKFKTEKDEGINWMGVIADFLNHL